MIDLYYTDPTGSLYTGDAIEWLQSLPTNTADLIFADPPYNIRKTTWDLFKSQDDYINWTLKWTHQAARILKPTGTLMICGFTEILADAKRPIMQDFETCKWLIWYYRNKANLSNDWGRSHESILLLRKSKKHFTMNIDDVRIPYSAHTLKYPTHPQAKTSQYNNGKKYDNWTPNPLGAKPKDVIEIPTTCNGMHEKTPHPTQKPEELLRRLILGASTKGDLVIDPFSGSGTTAVVSKQLHRRWLACDKSPEYNSWATSRLENVIDRSIDEWKAFDRENNNRRSAIR